MATESNTGFHCDETFSYALNRRAISFQSGAINSTSEMLPIGNYFGMNSSSAMMFSGNNSSSNNSAIIGNNPVIGNSYARGGGGGSLILDSVPGLKHDVGLAVEWSSEEQCRLERGLIEYGNEPSIMRYIKIAALLRDKTVRDVALRCRWMMRKRRKPEELIVGKKLYNRKDKLVESSSKIYTTSFSPLDVAGYPFIMNHVDHEKCMPFEGINGAAKHLLEQNAQSFNQITANLSTYKLQDNIDLFCRTRNNITAILNDMRNMPGIMSRMPPLPVSINEDLANNILPNTA